MASEKEVRETYFLNFWNFCKKKENEKQLINKIMTNKHI